MQAHVKNALITTAIVLGTIFVLRKVPMVGGFVDQAIKG
jgi:hypothetical protein